MKNNSTAHEKLTWLDRLVMAVVDALHGIISILLTVSQKMIDWNDRRRTK